jgi:hypothetical protein
MCGLLQSIGNHSRLHCFFDAVLGIGLAPAALEQRVHAALFVRVTVTIESIARDAHDAAGARDVAKFGGQIEQADLVLDDAWCKTGHGILRWVFAPSFDEDSHLYQNGKPHLLARGTVRSSLNFYS